MGTAFAVVFAAAGLCIWAGIAYTRYINKLPADVQARMRRIGAGW